jgi:hypothetical protein
LPLLLIDCAPFFAPAKQLVSHTRAECSIVISGLQVTVMTTDTMRTDPSGAQSTRTVRARNANGSYDSYGVVTVDTTKSDKIPAIQVHIAPDKPK